MSMFYFDVHDGDRVLSDDDGTDLADIEAARAHAIVVVQELMFRRDGMLDRDWSEWNILIRDGDGVELLRFNFSDVSAPE
jgi:Domain of unknown function (DUF6894)